MYLRSTLLLALLPALISADNQVPLKDKAGAWFDKAKAYVANAAPEIPNPVDAGASKVAEHKVEKINIRNYERKLTQKADSEEEWMIFITGGNKTCHGRCDRANLAWNESVPLLTALEPFSGSRLKLGRLDCEIDEILCTSFATGVPSIFHFIVPQLAGAGQTQAPSPMRDIRLNISSVEAQDIVPIPRASKSRYLEFEEYEGAFHPIDGSLRKFGLLTSVGYILWGFGSTPSWLIMIAVSFFSRQMMARRANRGPSIDELSRRVNTQPPAAGVASGASPAAAARGGAKKRK